MSAASVDAAAAVLDAINAAVVAEDFAFTFTAERAYVPKFVLEESIPKGLQVFVSPTIHGNVNNTRGDNRISVGVVVSVIKKLTDLSNEEIDPLVELVEQIKTLVSGVLDVGTERALCDLQDDPIYRPDVLVSQRTFWGMFTVTLTFPQ